MFSHRSVAALSAVMEGALLVRDVRDHRVGAAVHQNFRDLAVHVLQIVRMMIIVNLIVHHDLHSMLQMMMEVMFVITKLMVCDCY